MRANRVLLCSMILFISLFCLIPSSAGDKTRNVVYVIPVHGVIELGLSGFIDRVCVKTKEEPPSLMVLDINTFGGRVDAVVNICDSIAGLGDIPTVAFVTGEAWSAGALVAFACDTIIMTPGSSIGSAEPRGGTAGEEMTDEKTVSAISAKFKSVAEQKGHSARLASAMVDKDVELILAKGRDGEIQILYPDEWEEKSGREKKRWTTKVLTEKDKLLNLTAKEAQEAGLIPAILEDMDGLLKYMGIPDAAKEEFKPVWSENLVRIITHPLASSLLLTIGFLGLIFELRMPGWGISGTLGILSLVLFFWGHYLVGLADWLEIFLFLLGIGLLLIEFFVIPGFGVTGAAGIILVLAGLVLAMVKHPFEMPRADLFRAFSVVAYSFAASVLISVLAFKWFPKTGLWKRVVLDYRADASKGFSQDTTPEKFVGMEGITVTSLRPAGKAKIGGELVDVVTEGDFLDKGSVIRVVSTDGNRVVVRKVK